MTTPDHHERLDLFLADPKLKSLISWNRSQNFFDIFYLNEMNVSSFIAWLLNPKESHGLGDQFIKQLLIEVYQASCNEAASCQWKAKITSKLGSVFDIESCAFSEAFVDYEFSTPKGQRRIDIVVVDETNSIAIFIENKWGAKLSENQLNNYYNDFHDTFTEQDFQCIYVYLDEYGEELEENWTHLAYDWIYSFLKQAIDNNAVPEPALRILKDFYVYTSEDYTVDARYGDSLQTLKSMYNAHAEFINDIRTFRSQNHKCISSYRYLDVLKKPYTDYHYKLFKTFHSYSGIINSLLNMSEWDTLLDPIIRRTGNEELIDKKKRKLFFTTNEAYLATNNGYFDYWPLSILIEKGEEAYTVWMQVHQQFLDLFSEEIAARYNDCRQRTYYYIHKTEIPLENTQLTTQTAIDLYNRLEKRTMGRVTKPL